MRLNFPSGLEHEKNLDWQDCRIMLTIFLLSTKGMLEALVTKNAPSSPPQKMEDHCGFGGRASKHITPIGQSVVFFLFRDQIPVQSSVYMDQIPEHLALHRTEHGFHSQCSLGIKERKWNPHIHIFSTPTLHTQQSRNILSGTF